MVNEQEIFEFSFDDDALLSAAVAQRLRLIVKQGEHRRISGRRRR